MKITKEGLFLQKQQGLHASDSKVVCFKLHYIPVKLMLNYRPNSNQS